MFIETVAETISCKTAPKHEDICRGIGGFSIVEEMFCYSAAQEQRRVLIISTPLQPCSRGTPNRGGLLVVNCEYVSSECGGHDGEDKMHAA